jgi:hypothetical protein
VNFFNIKEINKKIFSIPQQFTIKQKKYFFQFQETIFFLFTINKKDQFSSQRNKQKIKFSIPFLFKEQYFFLLQLTNFFPQNKFFYLQLTIKIFQRIIHN